MEGKAWETFQKRAWNFSNCFHSACRWLLAIVSECVCVCRDCFIFDYTSIILQWSTPSWTSPPVDPRRPRSLVNGDPKVSNTKWWNPSRNTIANWIRNAKRIVVFVWIYKRILCSIQLVLAKITKVCEGGSNGGEDFPLGVPGDDIQWHCYQHSIKIGFCITLHKNSSIFHSTRWSTSRPSVISRNFHLCFRFRIRIITLILMSTTPMSCPIWTMTQHAAVARNIAARRSSKTMNKNLTLDWTQTIPKHLMRILVHRNNSHRTPPPPPPSTLKSVRTSRSMARENETHVKFAIGKSQSKMHWNAPIVESCHMQSVWISVARFSNRFVCTTGSVWIVNRVTSVAIHMTKNRWCFATSVIEAITLIVWDWAPFRRVTGFVHCAQSVLAVEQRNPRRTLQSSSGSITWSRSTVPMAKHSPDIKYFVKPATSFVNSKLYKQRNHFIHSFIHL